MREDNLPGTDIAFEKIVFSPGGATIGRRCPLRTIALAFGWWRSLPLIALSVLGSPAPLAAAVALDATSVTQVVTPAGNTISWSHNIGAGTGRALLVGVSLRRSTNDQVVSGVTWDGVPLTFKVRSQSTDPNRKYVSEIWYLTSPASGSGTLRVNFSGAVNSVVAGAASFTGVDAAIPLGATGVAGDTTGTPSVTVSSAPGETAIGVLSIKGLNNNSITPWSGQIEIWNDQTGNNLNTHVIGGGSLKAGAASVTQTWTVASTEQWSAVATTIRPAAPTTAGTITGTVFEDVHYGGGAGRDIVSAAGSPRPNARVELYNGSGAYLGFTTTDGSGAYVFPGLAAGNYTVRVVNGTVSSSRVGYVAGTHVGVQTFRTNGSGGAALPVTDHVGGQNPAVTDGPNGSAGAIMNTTTGVFTAGVSGTAQSIAPVTLSADGVGQADFGFSFDVIVNTNSTGQGSLDQFLVNANALGDDASLSQEGLVPGKENAVFMIPNGTSSPGLRATLDQFVGGVAIIRPGAALPAVSTPMVLDARRQPGWAGNPVVELDGSLAGGTPGALGVSGLRLTAGATTLRGFAINRFSGAGVRLESAGGDTIAANHIGTDVTGEMDRGNGWYGVYLVSVGNSVIGGDSPSDGNIVSGNDDTGIVLGLSGAANNIVRHNRIGVSASGAALLGNAGHGIDLVGTDANPVNGNQILDNLIAGNLGHGFTMTHGAGNTVRRNAFHANDSLGIDLGKDGVTPNDGAKVGTMPNVGMDHPVCTSVTLDGDTLRVAGYVGSAPGQSAFADAAVEFFAADGDEGRTFVGVLTSDASGAFDGAFDVNGLGIAAGDSITTSATDVAGNTSEFGPRREVIPELADMAVGVTVDQPAPAERDTIVLVVSLINHGPSPAGAMLSSALPAGLTHLSAIASQGSFTPGDGEWNVGVLAVNATATLTLSAVVNPSTGGMTLTHRVTVATVGVSDPVAVNDTASAVLQPQSLGARIRTGTYFGNGSASRAVIGIGFRPDVVIVKAVGGAAAVATTSTFVGTGAKQVGPVSPALAGLIGSLDADGFTVGADARVNANGVTYSWTAAKAGPGAMTIGSYVGDGAAFRAVPGVGFQPDYLIVLGENNGYAAQRFATESANLSLLFGPEGESGNRIKTFEPDGFTLGPSLDTNENGTTYHYAAWNAIPGVVTVGTYLAGGSDDAAITGTGLAPHLVFVKSKSALPAVHRSRSQFGDQTLSFLAGTPLPNRVQRLLPAGWEAGTDSTVNAAGLEYHWVAFRDSGAAISADLAVSLSASSTTPNVGDTLSVFVTIANNGPDPASGIEVTNRVPAGLEFVSALPSRGGYSPASGAWSVGALARGEGATLAIRVRVPETLAGATLADTAMIAATDAPDPITSNDRATLVIEVQDLVVSDLEVVTTVDRPAPNAGDTLVFAVLLRNLGPDPATGVEVGATAPAGLAFQWAQTTGGTYSGETGSWLLGDLGSGQSDTLTIGVVALSDSAGRTLEFSSSVRALDQGDPESGNDSHSTSVTVQLADLAVGMYVTNEPPSGSSIPIDVPAPNEGDPVVFVVNLVNRGPHPATGVVVTCRQPAGLDGLSTDVDRGVYDQATGTWSVGTLSIGASARLYHTAVTPAGSAGATFVDSATIARSDQTDPVTGNDTAMASVTVQAADLALTATVDDSAPQVGETVTVHLSLRNDGPFDATGVVVENRLPAGLTFRSATANPGTFSPSGTWTVGALPGGGTVTLAIAAEVDGDAAGRTLVDTARVVAADQGDPDPTDDVATTSLVVPVRLAASVSPQGSPTFRPGAASREVLRLSIANRDLASVTLDAITLTNRANGPGSQADLDAAWQPILRSLEVVTTDARGLAAAPTSAEAAAPLRSAASSASFVGGRARFGGLGVTLAPGDSTTLLFWAGASLAARDGDELDLEVANASDIEWDQPVVVNGTWPLSPPGSFPVDGMTAAQIQTRDVGDAEFANGSARNLAFAAVLPANGYAPDVLQKLNVINEGSARAVADLGVLELWRDADDDGRLDLEVDTRIGVMEFTGDRWEVTGLSVPVPPEGLPILVTCDVTASASVGRTVRLALPGPPDFGVGMASENDGPVDGIVRGASVQTLTADDLLVLTALPTEAGTVAPGAKTIPLLHLAVSNRYDAPHVLATMAVTNLTAGPGGRAERDGEITQIALRHDADGDGVLGDLDVDPLLGIAYFRDGRATFGGIGWSIAAGDVEGLFVTADLSVQRAADGDVLGVHLEDASAIGFFESPTVMADWPLDSGVRRTVDGMVAAQVVSLDAPAATIGPGEGPALALDVIAPPNGYASDVLDGIQVVNAGTATVADLADVRLWRDGGDGAFDAGTGDDRDLGPLSFAAGRWSSPLLSETLAEGGVRVFASVTAAATVTDSATVQFRIPRMGIRVQSGNDGPVDTTVTNPGELRLSNSALLASIELDPTGCTVGQVVTARMNVRNAGATGLIAIAPTALVVAGDATLAVVSGPSPASLDLAAGASGTFEWTLSAIAPGTASVRGAAAGVEVGSGRDVESILARSEPHRVLLQAIDLDLFSTGSMPFAINRGQTQVVPLTLTFTNNGGDGASDILLKRLSVRLQDANGASVVPASLLARAMINEGTNVFLNKTTLESSGSTIDLSLAQPARIQSGGLGGRQVTLSLSLDIHPGTTVPNFRVVIDSSANIAAEDANSGAAVVIQLAPGQSYPLQSGLARVVAEAVELDVAPVAAADGTAGRGQADVPLLLLDLLNPGPFGLGSDVRASGLAVTLLDSTGAAVRAPGAILRRISVGSGAQRFVDREITPADDSTLTLAFTSLLSVPVATPTQIVVVASIADGAPLGRYRLRLGDPAALDARDANTGREVPVVYGSPAIVGQQVTIQARADSLRAVRRSGLPAAVTLGSRDVPALVARLRHAGAPGAASIECRSLTLRCRDQQGGPLVPAAFINRLRVLRDGVEIGLVSSMPASGGLLDVPLAGLIVAPGDTAVIELRLDIEATAPPALFGMEIAADGVAAFDRNLGTAVVLVPEPAMTLPLETGLTQLQLPARHMAAGFGDAMPAVLVADDRSVEVATLTLRNTAAVASGAIEVSHLDLRAADLSLAPLPIGEAVTRVEAWIADTLWASSPTLSSGEAVARLAATTLLSIGPAEQARIALRIVLRSDAAVRSLRIGAHIGDVGVVQPDNPLLAVLVTAESGQTFPFWTEAASFPGRSLTESYANFPNPFAAGRELTRFVFYLRDPARVELRIWTARGEPVRTLLDQVAFPAGLEQAVTWDGRTASGGAVVNGAYLAELQVRYDNGASERLLRKVAVIR